MTVASKLQVLAAIKAAQYEAIIAKGGTLSPGDWSAYAAAIAALPSGGGAYNPDFPSPIFTFFPADTFVNGDEPTSKAWYVRPGGAGDKDGRDWDNAFATREDAIIAADAGDHIRVMEGLYYIGTMQVPKYGVSEYYGFTQADGTWATRNPWLHPSKLDACFTSNRWQNDSVVFTIGQMVDGLWVQNVFGGNGITSLRPGTFRNVSTVNCTGATNGGGMYFATGTVDRAFATKCSASNGGGIYLNSSSTAANCVVTNCIASNYGGGMYLNSSTAANCVVTNCTAPAGGGMHLQNGSTATNCVVTNCTSGNQSGGMNLVYSSAATNCTVILCSAPTGSGFWVGDNSQRLYNCCSWGCDIYLAQANYAYKIYNCASNFALTGGTNWDTVADVQNFLPLSTLPFKTPGVAPFDGSGAYNANLAKGEESLAFIDRVVLPSVADPHLPAGSPLIGAGYYQAGVTPDTDADGKARPLTPSIGAYEP